MLGGICECRRASEGRERGRYQKGFRELLIHNLL
jgi:hypothetical protein